MTKDIKGKVIIVPTDKASRLLKRERDNVFLFDEEGPRLNINAVCQIEGLWTQHLYIVSNEKLENNDWVYFLNNKNVIKQFSIGDPDLAKKYGFRIYKIIASTDESLNLPIIPNDFVKEYCKADGKIEEVCFELTPQVPLIKISQLNIKENWSRTEVVELLRKAWRDSYTFYMPKFTYDFDYTNKWIDNNVNIPDGK